MENRARHSTRGRGNSSVNEQYCAGVVLIRRTERMAARGRRKEEGAWKGVTLDAMIDRMQNRERHLK